MTTTRSGGGAVQRQRRCGAVQRLCGKKGGNSGGRFGAVF